MSQRIADYEVDFSNGNFGAGIALNYRWYGRSAISLETGMGVITRTFHTIQFRPGPNRGGVPGRASSSMARTVRVPLRVFWGKPARHRTDRNETGGVFAGVAVSYIAHQSNGATALQSAIFRRALPRITPQFSVGGRKSGRFANLQFELFLPLRGWRDLDYAGATSRFMFREFGASLGIGHTF